MFKLNFPTFSSLFTPLNSLISISFLYCKLIFKNKIFSVSFPLLPLNSSQKMKPSKLVTPFVSKRRRSFPLKTVPTLVLLCATVFICSVFIVTDYKERLSPQDMLNMFRGTRSKKCEGQCKPVGTEGLPRGIISSTSDLEMRPLWGALKPVKPKPNMNLLAMAVGVKQKESVDNIARKFLEHNFVVMLFHYDGNVDDWRDLEWNSRALHIVASDQTKWWFAKRFLHPDIVSRYSYIFLWDEDLGVENFSVQRYLHIIKKEGLEISQPALDPEKSEVHHKLTARQMGPLVHRKMTKILPGGRKCDENSTEPPCTGWVEMMAPVFSKAAWRCAWYMIQNDLIHAWGVDFQLGYCAQGDRTKKVGIVDSAYVIHYGLPTLGDPSQNKTDSEASSHTTKKVSSLDSLQEETLNSNKTNTRKTKSTRNLVRDQSLAELETFKNRWKNAAKDDDCWVDPYEKPMKKKTC